jgi:hypothetical protein
MVYGVIGGDSHGRVWGIPDKDYDAERVTKKKHNLAKI